jgi:hypothetical protein
MKVLRDDRGQRILARFGVRWHIGEMRARNPPATGSLAFRAGQETAAVVCRGNAEVLDKRTAKAVGIVKANGVGNALDGRAGSGCRLRATRVREEGMVGSRASGSEQILFRSSIRTRFTCPYND